MSVSSHLGSFDLSQTPGWRVMSWILPFIFGVDERFRLVRVDEETERGLKEGERRDAWKLLLMSLEYMFLFCLA